VAAVSCSAVIAAVGPAVGRDHEAPGEGVRRHVVQKDDTLWSIAVEAAGAGEDPRPLVDAMIRVNGIDPGRLVPGSTIAIPAG
jgi:hypothetical protein